MIPLGSVVRSTRVETRSAAAAAAAHPRRLTFGPRHAPAALSAIICSMDPCRQFLLHATRSRCSPSERTVILAACRAQCPECDTRTLTHSHNVAPEHSGSGRSRRTIPYARDETRRNRSSPETNAVMSDREISCARARAYWSAEASQ